MPPLGVLCREILDKLLGKERKEKKEKWRRKGKLSKVEIKNNM